MSASVESESDTMMFCASCGTAGSDDIKLKKCTACYLARYCSVKCQKDHWKQHKKECKKRAAELKDEILFKQPEGSHWGDCPICCLPLPLDPHKAILNSCCCKRICTGCDLANKRREEEGRLDHTCPFCRETLPNTDEECIEQLKKRTEANDPVAMYQMGTIRKKEEDYEAAFEYLTRAVALGDTEAHYPLYVMYRDGLGVEKDEKRELHHVEQAAIGWHHMARHDLGVKEWERNGRMDRAVRHWIIAAKLGFDRSLDNIKDGYKIGYVSKEDLATALRDHHAAIEATKSAQRKEAAEFEKERGD